MQNLEGIQYAKDDSRLWALLEEAKKRRAAKGIKEEPPFDREDAQRIYEHYKAKQERQRQLLQPAFLAFFEPMNNNGFRAVCPAIENCTVEAPTREEAKTALIDELKQRLRARLQAGEPLPIERGSAEMVEVALNEL